MNPTLIRAVAALAGGALVVAFGVTKAASARLEKDIASVREQTATLNAKLDQALAEREQWKGTAGGLEAKLAEATNALAAVPPKDVTQEAVHEKLRGEIARLSEETVRKDTQIDAMRAQARELQEAKTRTDAALRETQAAFLTSSNEVVRLRGQDADKAARLAGREQELANMRTDLANADKAAREAAAARDNALKQVQELQARAGADQAELARLRQRLAELESEKAGAPAP